MADTDLVGPQKEGTPPLGDVRTVGAETRRWDGTAWRLVPRSFLGTEDFTGRMREYAKPLAKTMASDLASPVLHPIDTVTGIASSALHPLDTLSKLYGVGRSAVTRGDPESVGHILAILAAPKTADTALSGVNSAAHAVAENPAVRSGVGYIGGAGTALATGAGHPFIGGVMGRLVAPLLEKPAAEVANATDWLKSKVHGAGGSGVSVPPELQRDYATVRSTLGPESAEKWLQREIERSKAPQAGPQEPSKPIHAAEAPVDTVERLAIPEQYVADYRSILKRYNKDTADRWLQQQTKPKATGKSAKFTETNAGGDDLGALTDALHGGDTPTVPNGGTASGLADDLGRMRREYGADRVGRAVNPQAPAAGTGNVLQVAPGPSAMPDVAQRAVLRDLKAGTSANPQATARAIQQLLTEYKRNAGPAKSPVAQELAALLKKHGFIKE